MAEIEQLQENLQHALDRLQLLEAANQQLQQNVDNATRVQPVNTIVSTAGMAIGYFEGRNNDSFSAYLDKFNTFTTALGADDVMRHQVLPHLLKPGSRAFDIYRELPEEVQADYVQLIEQLRQRLEPPGYCWNIGTNG